jgi:transaldolase
MSHPWKSSGQKRTIAWSCEQPKEVLAYLADMQDAIKYALQVGYRDAGLDPVKTIQQVLPVLERSGEARLIVGSIRKPEDVEEIVSAGAHIATITPKVLNALPFHPKAEETIREFDDAWKEFVAKNNLLLSSLQRPQFHLV